MCQFDKNEMVLMNIFIMDKFCPGVVFREKLKTQCSFALASRIRQIRRMNFNKDRWKSYGWRPTRNPFFSPLVRLTGHKPAAHLNQQTSCLRLTAPTTPMKVILWNKATHKLISNWYTIRLSLHPNTLNVCLSLPSKSIWGWQDLTAGEIDK